MLKKILIADDLDINRAILGGMLKSEYEILEAADGGEALRILAEEHGGVSAMLLDINMPVKNGYEVLGEVRSDADLTLLPVIMITGDEEQETRVKALTLGANDFVIKPYNADIIRHCLRNNIALHEAAATVRALQRDRLTGLYNREAFFDRVRKQVGEHEAGYYIMASFDIDKFKVINDQYGTEKGDEVLKHVAHTFADGFTPNGGICCRIAGDKFAVLYPKSFSQSVEIAQMRTDAGHVKGLITPIIFSIGRYIIDDPSMLPASMYDRAVLAAETVKGRYDVKVALYDEKMREHLIREQAIVTEMESALAERQFEAWFQPQYNHSTGALVGAEALVRWRHPQKGLIPPGCFIPVFEQNGFVYSLDKYVWEEVCRYLRKWSDEGRSPLPVSVNISRYDILHGDVVSVITDLVKQYGIPASLLRLEVTESAFAESSQEIVSIVQQFVDYGFTVEIDDFGSGYSSLNTLKDVPAQILKLDMKFMQSSGDSQRSGNIVESIVRMAKWLGMSVIAEGVEVKEQADYLRSIGCNYIQGYLYAKPMPANEYEEHCKGAGKEEHLLSLETVENLDNNTFWDPASMDTLIFNSYVGGACIFEYTNGKIEMLRANEKHALAIGSTAMTVSSALRLDWNDYLDEDSRRRVTENIERSISTREEVTDEYLFLDLPGCPHETYLRTTMRVIARTGSANLVYCLNENITAQREAERRERSVADEMRVIMANVNGGITAVAHLSDGGVYIIFANDNFYSMYGYTREQFSTELTSAYDAIVPEDRERVARITAELVANNGRESYDYRCKKRDGSIITVRCNSSVTAFEGITDTIILSVTTDITEMERSRAQEQLHAEQLRAIMKNIDGGVTATVVDGGKLHRVFANDRFYEQLGTTRDEYERGYDGMPGSIVPEDIGRVMERCRVMNSEYKPEVLDFRIKRPDGTIRWLRSSISVMDYPGIDKPVQLSVSTDITEQLEAQSEVLRLSQQMQVIMDNVDLGIIAAVVKDGKAHYVFVNNRYYELLGYTKEQFEAEVDSPYVTVAPEDRQRVMDETARINYIGGKTVIIYRALKRNGEIRYIRSAISIGMIREVGDPVQLSILRDITDEVKTEQREKSSAEQLQAIMRDIGCGVVAATLRDNRVELLFTNEQFYAVHGYTREQFDAEVGDIFTPIHEDDRKRVYEDVMAAYRREIPTQIEYRIVCRDGSERRVKVGVSSTRFPGVEQNVHLCIFTDITAQKAAEEEKLRASAQLQIMMGDMPGGFARLRIFPGGSIKPIYFNEGFMKLIGLSGDEIASVYGDDALAGVHPDDIGVAHDAIAQLLRDGKARSSRYRVRGKGGYIWISSFGRITDDTAGRTFLNIYFSDATEQVREEQTQRELLDNLPCGSGLYGYKDGKLSVIHLNKRYWELADRTPKDCTNVSPIVAVYPDDVTVLMRELDTAIEQGRDMSCDIRLLHGENEYAPFHLEGRITGSGDGYSVYTIFKPIISEPINYQQVLPILMSAMMESTSDLSFAKSRDFVYLTASRNFANMVGVADENDIVGKTDYDLFDKEMADKFRHDDEELLKSGHAIVDMIEPIPNDESTPHYSSTSKYLLRDSSGEIIGLYGVGRDVTGLFALDSQLRLVNNSIPGGLATYVCTEGDFSPENITITYFNDGFCRLFGFSRQEYERRASEDPASMVFPEDYHIIVDAWLALMRHNVPIDCMYRANMCGGGYKWISHKAVIADRQKERVVINAILQDVTDQHELIEQLRISKEENNLALKLGGNIICRYTIEDKTLTMSPDVAASFSLPETIVNVPYEPVSSGMISPDSADAYIGFFESIRHGKKVAGAIFRQKYLGGWRWLEAKSTTVFSDAGKPVKAVVSFCDVTERLEREAIYKKWQQSLEDKRPEAYTLYRCSLNNVAVCATVEGMLIAFDFDGAGSDFNTRAASYIGQCVHADDREAYAAFVNSDALLAGYYRGKRSGVLEYRELTGSGERWLRLSIDLVEYPNSSEVEAYLMYEDIDRAKRAELQTKELSETDSLTGVFNRAAFAARAEQLISGSEPEAEHALLILDIDGFKQVNDVFGHAAGDDALRELADGLSALVGAGDLVARLGGDEFLMFMSNIPSESVVTERAKKITLMHKAFSVEVQISVSVGIAMVPRDGRSFEELYKKSDAALYYVKGSGKGSYAYYREFMADEHLKPDAELKETGGLAISEKKRRVLIVDDNYMDNALLQNILKDDFIIEKAKDAETALIRLRHYGSAISVVLLDLIMPGASGFTVLEKMQGSAELRAIPVIIVSGDESRDTCLKAIRKGATDYITKPVDPDILKVRVHSAVTKAENERLRATNYLLEVQNEERIRYEFALESTGVTFIEYNWLTGDFSYYPSISNYLLGNYDGRRLWQILLSDMVADTQTVQDMQYLVHYIAEDRVKMSGSRIVKLKNPQRITHRFRMNVRKSVNEYQLTNKLVIALTDIDYMPND